MGEGDGGDGMGWDWTVLCWLSCWIGLRELAEGRGWVGDGSGKYQCD